MSGLNIYAGAKFCFAFLFFFHCFATIMPVAQAADRDAVHRPTVALALGGGGARCAAHIGVLRELEKAHIKVDYVVGCSMGAIIGGLYCSGISIDKIEDFVLKKDGLFRALLPTPVAVRFIGHLPAFVAHAAHLPKSIGLYSGKELGLAIDRLVEEKYRKIENLPISFAAVATDLTDGNVVVIKDGDLGDAIQASSAVPGLFRASSAYPGKLLIDGGLRANVPARQARAMGADIVIAVNADENLAKVEPVKFKQFAVLSNRLVSILLDSIDEHQLESADFVVRPKQSGVSLYSRKPADMELSILAGSEATAALVDKIKEKISALSER